MAKKSKLTEAAVKIGTAAGKADRTARQTANKAAIATRLARKELVQLAKQMDALKKQLKKSSKRLKRALR
jgi:hypothetical protein